MRQIFIQVIFIVLRGDMRIGGESKAMAPFTSADRFSSCTLAPLRPTSALTPETFQKRLPFSLDW